MTRHSNIKQSIRNAMRTARVAMDTHNRELELEMKNIIYNLWHKRHKVSA